jgi:hydroxyethylthiazole kinase-like uncharacterized protein yjeF
MILARSAPIPSNVYMFALHAPFPAIIHDSAGTKAIDRAIIEAGTPGFALMMRAAHAALDRLNALAQAPRAATCVVVLAGPGNNGGDGYGLAALAYLAGYPVSVIAYGAPQQDAQIARGLCENLGLEIRPWAGALPSAAIYIDALLGIGLNRAPEGAIADIIRALNAVHESNTAKIIALDIASGLDADSGRVPGVCVSAHLTVTFLTLKAGLLTGNGPDHCGDLYFSDLLCETKLAPAVARLLTPPGFLASQPAATAHKGTKGNVALLAGAAGMEGAGQLSGLAALRAGAGKVFWATPDSAFERPPELILTPPTTLLERIADWHVCVAGPGLGDGFDAQLEALWQADIPLVLDADGLRWLARARPAPRPAPLIATPHPGEARALLADTEDLAATDRFAQLKALQTRYGGIWVLKGAGTLIGGAMTSLCPFADGRLGTAGAGDVLAGLIGGLWAQHREMAADQIAQAGVYLHTHAARLAIKAHDGHAIIASDLTQTLGRAFQHARYVLAGDGEKWSVG